MSKVFFSHAVGAARLPFSAMPPLSSPSSRHWESLACAYRDGLVACGQVVRPVLRPEIYQTEVAQLSLGVTAGDWHLVVKPIEHIRPFHGMTNVFVSDWPFPTLSCKTGGISPFYNHVRLLNQAAAVACCTEATAETLRSAGVARAVHAPPFCSARTNPDLEPFRPARETCTIMAAIDIDLLPRFHLPLIQGFALAQAQNRHLRLVLAVSGAVSGAGSRSAAEIRGDILGAAGVEDSGSAIAVEPMPFAEVLPGSDHADFFLWEGLPFGLPLPLIDATLAGLPLIASEPDATAVGLSPHQFIPLETRPRPVEAVDEVVAQIMPLTHEASTPPAVRDAILAAASLDGESRTTIARTGRRTIESHFGLEAFRSGLRRLAPYVPTELHDEH